jgi:conjugative transfer signal peptidase TraF
MKPLAKKIGIAIAIIMSVLLIQGIFLYLIGARINTTSSIPAGLYWRVDRPIDKGAYVMFCPPQVQVFKQAMERGYIGSGMCPGGYGYMMKRVFGATNDRIDVGRDGLRVNGMLLDRSIPLVADGSARPMPRYQADSYVLSEYQLLLMGDLNPNSFDGRYFGPIQRGQVREVIVPVLTWDSNSESGAKP